MTKKIIRQLNQINRDFYQQVGAEFAQTRIQPWPTWHELIKWIRPLFGSLQPIKVLDIGCGSGRWWQFLNHKCPTPFQFIGIHNNQYLLHSARNISGDKKGVEWQKMDIVESLLDQTWPAKIVNFHPHLITAFGLFHHLPGSQLRKELLMEIKNWLNPSGFLIITSWNFLANSRLKKRALPLTKLDIPQSEIEPGDYLLDWADHQQVWRYCHAFSDQELTDLWLETGWKVIEQFTGDGPKNQGNYYFILQPRR